MPLASNFGIETATSTPTANRVPQAGGAGKLATGWVSEMVGSNGTIGGTAGSVPAPGAADNLKFLRGDGTWAVAGGGVADHGDLTGLGDDDHPQYHNDARGDARYPLLAHTHTFASLTSKPTTISGYGITDLNSLGDARWAVLAHTHTFASLTSKPTTISGYGITDLNSLGDARWAALVHATSHKTGGADAIKLDELAATTDVTTLNATTSAHGLLPKLGGGTTNFLRADGTWAAPAGGGGGVDTGWTAFTPVIDAVTTNPAKGGTLQENCVWRRDGSDMLINFFYRQGSAGAAGSGVYKFKIPGSDTVDTAKVRAGDRTSGTTRPSSVGSGYIEAATVAAPQSAIVEVYDATSLAVWVPTSNNAVGSGVFPLSGADVVYAFTARVPITGWTVGGSGSGSSGPLVQTKTVTSAAAITSASTSFVDTGIDATLGSTLGASTNKVRIRVAGFTTAASVMTTHFRILADGVDITPGAADSVQNLAIAGTDYSIPFAFEFEHSPGATAPQQYKLQWKGSSGATRRLNHLSVAGFTGSTSITLEEINPTPSSGSGGGGGAVVQTKHTVFTTQSTSNNIDNGGVIATFFSTGLSVTLDNALKAASAPVRLRFNLYCSPQAACTVRLKVYRNGVDLFSGEDCVNTFSFAGTNTSANLQIEVVDPNPGSTTPATYSLRINSDTASLLIAYNRLPSYTGYGGRSTATAEELSA